MEENAFDVCNAMFRSQNLHQYERIVEQGLNATIGMQFKETRNIVYNKLSIRFAKKRGYKLSIINNSQTQSNKKLFVTFNDL